jgi:hypothetical protein
MLDIGPDRLSADRPSWTVAEAGNGSGGHVGCRAALSGRAGGRARRGQGGGGGPVRGLPPDVALLAGAVCPRRPGRVGGSVAPTRRVSASGFTGGGGGGVRAAAGASAVGSAAAAPRAGPGRDGCSGPVADERAPDPGPTRTDHTALPAAQTRRLHPLAAPGADAAVAARHRRRAEAGRRHRSQGDHRGGRLLPVLRAGHRRGPGHRAGGVSGLRRCAAPLWRPGRGAHR